MAGTDFGNVTGITADLDNALRAARPATPTLKSGDGGGTFDGMEARVAKLEALAEYTQSDVGELKADMKDARDRLRAIEVKVDHLPSKGFIVSGLIVALAVIAGLVTFADQLRAVLAG